MYKCNLMQHCKFDIIVSKELLENFDSILLRSLNDKNDVMKETICTKDRSEVIRKLMVSYIDGHSH